MAQRRRRCHLPCVATGLVCVILTALIYYIQGRSLTTEDHLKKLRDSGAHFGVSTGHYKGETWKNRNTLATTLLGETPFARCDMHSVLLEDGKTIINDWIFMEERDAVNVAVRTKEGEWLVFETNKYAIPGKTLSPVGGFINDGETPWEAARREVWEELGVGSEISKREMGEGQNLLKSKESKENPFGTKNGINVPIDEHGLAKGDTPGIESDWIFLGRYRTMANRGGGFLYAYFLKNAVTLANEDDGSVAGNPNGDVESQELIKLTNVKLREAIENGDFQEVKWALTLSLALQRVESVNEE